MPIGVIKRRSRFVTFRVSPDEYEALAAHCLNAGARSVSEFSRAAVLSRMQSINASTVTLAGDLATLSRSLMELDAALDEIRKRLRAVLGPESKAEGQSAG